MMQDNLKSATKATKKEPMKQYGKVNIDKIEQMQDETADLMMRHQAGRLFKYIDPFAGNGQGYILVEVVWPSIIAHGV